MTTIASNGSALYISMRQLSAIQKPAAIISLLPFGWVWVMYRHKGHKCSFLLPLSLSRDDACNYPQ